MKCIAGFAGVATVLMCTCAAGSAADQMNYLSKELVTIRALHPAKPVQAGVYGSDTSFLIGRSKRLIFQYLGMPDACWAPARIEPCVSARGWTYLFSKSPPGWFGGTLDLDLTFSEKAKITSAKWHLGK